MGLLGEDTAHFGDYTVVQSLVGRQASHREGTRTAYHNTGNNWVI